MVKPGLTGLWQVKAEATERCTNTRSSTSSMCGVTVCGGPEDHAPHDPCILTRGLLRGLLSRQGWSWLSVRTLVTGAGGFIGNHLVNYLKDQGHWVRGVDIKRPEYSDTLADEFLELDLRDRAELPRGDEGRRPRLRARGRHGRHGIHLREPRHDPAQQLVDRHPHASRPRPKNGVKRLLYTSSACVYPEHMQLRTDIAGLREEDAYPAAPQDAYGWEKVLGEQLLQVLPGRVRHGDAHRAVPQHLRPARCSR